MSSILKDQKIKAAIQEIALRTEQEDPAEANESFYDCNIISHFLNFNHQIIQGRRGTGKTHILVVLKKRLEKKGYTALYSIVKLLEVQLMCQMYRYQRNIGWYN